MIIQSKMNINLIKLINGIHRNCDLDKSQRTHLHKIHCRNFSNSRVDVNSSRRGPENTKGTVPETKPSRQ